MILENMRNNHLSIYLVCNHPVIQNGHLESGDNVRYRSGTQTSIECDEGYELRNGHHAGIICKEDGSWQPVNQKEFPICKYSFSFATLILDFLSYFMYCKYYNDHSMLCLARSMALLNE